MGDTETVLDRRSDMVELRESTNETEAEALQCSDKLGENRMVRLGDSIMVTDADGSVDGEGLLRDKDSV